MTKLDLPDCTASYENIIGYDDKLAFVVNAQDGSYIYIYNKTTGEVKQGLKVEGTRKIFNLKTITK